MLVSKKEAGITTPGELKGKKVGNWMGGNEFEILALFLINTSWIQARI
ncbi:ABC transporter substrate-binding protein [Paenibacillus rhizoplanae]